MAALQKPRQRRLDVTAHANTRPSGQVCPRIHPLPPPVPEKASPVPIKVSALTQPTACPRKGFYLRVLVVVRTAVTYRAYETRTCAAWAFSAPTRLADRKSTRLNSS